MMKRFLALWLCVGMMAAALTACGSKKENELLDRNNYKNGTLQYVELFDLESLSVDTESEDFLSTKNELISTDLKNNPLTYNDGAMQKGDIANIDYAGSVGGVAFTGGTATAQELELGSGSFIDGFEDQLIGVNVGETVNVNVTFPDGYKDSTDLATGSQTLVLANQPAVFVVKVNSFNRPSDELNSAVALKLGFESVDAYMESAERQAINSYLMKQVVDGTTIKTTPSDEYGNTYAYYKKYYTSYAQNQGGTFENFLSYNNMTEDQFRSEVTKTDLISYACFDKLGLTFDQTKIDEKIASIASDVNATNEEVLEYYTINYIEAWVVNDIVTDALRDKADFIAS